MRSVLVDTAVIYALADRTDQAHDIAKALVTRLVTEQTPLLISLPTIYEAHRLILYRLGMQAGQIFLERYPRTYNTVWLTEAQHAQAVALIQRYADRDLSLIDAANAVIARALKARVASFDHHYEVIGIETVRA